MWKVADSRFQSRLILGTALYPSPEIMQEAIRASEAGIVTVSLRRQAPESRSGIAFWEMLKACSVKLLPNTAGCHTVDDAVTTAQMAREIFNTNWIKLEITGDDYLLAPNGFATVEAARILVKDGFEVFPYTTEDVVVGEHLVDAGCRVLMPWAAPIGSARGFANPLGLRTYRERFKEQVLIVDAGIGSPAHAAQAMEWGYDGVLLNTAVAKSADPVKMAHAFGLAVRAGRFGFEAGILAPRETASPSTPIVGRPFWQENL